MTAVAVWDHRPTAHELLEARLAAGWQPTPTATRSGDVILGYAACVWRPDDATASTQRDPQEAPQERAKDLTPKS